MFKRPIVALDIGTDSVKALQLKRSSSGLRLTKIGIRDYPRPLDPRKKTDRPLIIETIRDLFEEARFKTKKVVFALPRYHSFVERVDLPIEGERKIERIISLNLSHYIPLRANQVYFSYQILKKETAKTEVFIAACKKEVVNDYLSIVRGAGLLPSIIEVSSGAILNASIINYPQDEVLAILDVRAGMSEVAIISKGELLFSRGFILDGREKHLYEIQRSLDAFRAEYPEIKTDRIILAGEGLRLPGLKDLVERELELEVEIADPLKNILFDHPNIHSIGYRLMDSIGLAIRGMQKKGFNLLPHKRTKTTPHRRKILVTLPALAPLILLLALGLLLMDLGKKEERLKAIDQRLSEQRDEVEEVRELKRRLALVGCLRERGTTSINTLKELNRIIPDRVWLTELFLDGERLQIQGQTTQSSCVADLLVALNDSSYFKEATLASSGLTKINDREVVDFRIDCQTVFEKSLDISK